MTDPTPRPEPSTDLQQLSRLRPYPGLRPFKKNEWSLFFGREIMTEEIIARLMRDRLVILHGASGCGKSSLVTAGVLPRLEHEHHLSGVTWRTAYMRPGGAPLWHLAEAFARLASDIPDKVIPEIARTRAVLRHLRMREGTFDALHEDDNLRWQGHVCILLDQFEELFRFASANGREETETLINVLKAFVADPPSGMHVIVTMRSDYLGDCARFDGFAELINKTQYLLPRMDEEALIRAIREPATLFNGEVSQDLSFRLRNESQAEVDALPLVQHCLMRLWHQEKKPSRRGLEEAEADAPAYQLEEPPTPSFGLPRDPRTILTTKGYDGLQRLLSDHAEDMLTRLRDEHPDNEFVAEHLFRSIIEIEGNGSGLRRPRRKSEIVALFEDEEQAPRLDDVIKKFNANDCGFLNESNDEDPVIDVSHEALIRCWTRLNDPTIDEETGRPIGWLQREREDRRLWYSLLEHADQDKVIAADKIDKHQNFFDRLPGPPWADRYGGGWEQVHNLLDKSQKKRDADEREAEQEERKRQEEERQAAEREKAERRRVRKNKINASVAAGLFVAMMAVISGLWIHNRSLQMEQQRIESLHLAVQARAQLVQGNPTGALRLALVGLPPDPARPSRPWVGETAGVLVEALGALRKHDVLLGHGDDVNEVAISPDGRWIASVSADRTIRVWDSHHNDGPRIIGNHKVALSSLAFSPDGQQLVIGSLDGKLHIWDIANYKQINVLEGHRRGVTAVAVSSDNRFIVSASSFLRSPFEDPAFLEDNRAWQEKSDDLFIWDASSFEQRLLLKGHEESVKSVAISPDDRWIVSGSSDDSVRVWDAITGEQEMILQGHEGDVRSVAMTPDGNSIVSGSNDGTIRIWDAVTGNPLRTVESGEAILSIAITKDGQRVVSGSSDGAIRIWDAVNGKLLDTLAGHEEAVTSVVISSDGKRVVSGSSDDSIRVWDMDQNQRTNILEGHDDAVHALAITADGSQIYSGSWDKTVRVWDARTGTQIKKQEEDTIFNQDYATFPDQKRIADGAEDNVLRIRDAETNEIIREFRGHTESINAVAVSNGGSRIISGDAAGKVRVWNAENGEELLSLEGHEDKILAVAFSQDDTRFASGAGDGTIRIWDARDGALLQVLNLHDEAVSALTFSPGGDRIASGSYDRTIRYTWIGQTKQELIHRARAWPSLSNKD